MVESSGTAGVEVTPTLEPTALVTAGPVGAGLVAYPVSEGAGVLAASTELGREGALVEVKVTVETVLEVVTKVDDPEVTVLVTGHVVTVT